MNPKKIDWVKFYPELSHVFLSQMHFGKGLLHALLPCINEQCLPEEKIYFVYYYHC